MFMFVIWIYLHIFVRKRFPYHMMSESFNSYTTGTTSGAGTAYPSRAPKLTHPISVGYLLLNLSLSVSCSVHLCLSFFVGYCIVCPSIYSSWLPFLVSSTPSDTFLLQHWFIYMLILVLKEAELFIYPTAAETQYYYFDMFELYCRSYSCFFYF
jgi:hypothetical protein